MKHCTIFIHGIQVRDELFALPMARMLGLHACEWTSVMWASAVQDDLLRYAQLYTRPAARFINPVAAFQQWSIRLLRECNQWVQCYMEDGNRKEALERVRRQIENKRAELGQACGFSFVSHSLGTVVMCHAIEALIADGTLRPEDVRTLVTMGSPLHGLKPIMTSKAMLHAIPSNRWINLFDENDLIAGRLAPIHVKVEDIEVSTGWTMFGAHVGYWESARVASVIRKALPAAEGGVRV